jgi:hypothetical protein
MPDPAGDQAVLAYPFVHVEPTSTQVPPVILLEFFPTLWSAANPPTGSERRSSDGSPPGDGHRGRASAQSPNPPTPRSPYAVAMLV